MAKPTHSNIESTGQGWDGAVDDNFDLVFETPLPVAEYSSVASLPAAGSFDRCLAVVDDATADWILTLSDGSNWKLIGTQAAAVADLNQTITNPPTQAEVQAITDKIDELLDALRTTGVIAP